MTNARRRRKLPRVTVELDPSSSKLDAPIKETPTKGTPAKETPTKEKLAKEKPTKEKPTKEKPTKKTPTKKTPTKKTPAKEKPAKEKLTKGTPTKKTPTKGTPTKETPAKGTPAKEKPTKKTPAKKTPAKETPAKETLAEETSKNETPVKSDSHNKTRSRAQLKLASQNRFELPALSQQPSGKKKRKVSKRGRECDSDSGLTSPEVVITERMTRSKLKLLQQSPLRRLIPEVDRKAAVAQVARNESRDKQAVALKSKAQSSKNSRQNLDDIKLKVAKKKEARKMKWKARTLRKEGKLQVKDTNEHSELTGVVYLGHIPHGFYEKEMQGYFSQFGDVLRVRLSRSPKTARSRGYAFIEFSNKEVAEIAAEAMDGYLMHGQKLVAKYVSAEKLHADAFKGANRSFRHIPWSKIERKGMLKRLRDPLKVAKRSKRILKSAKRKQSLLAEQGLMHKFLQLPQMASKQD